MQKAPLYRIRGIQKILSVLDGGPAKQSARLLESDIALKAKTFGQEVEMVYGQILTEFEYIIKKEGCKPDTATLRHLVETAAGPLVRRTTLSLSEEVRMTSLPSLTQEKCAKCGGTMILFEKQTRSADEGASIVHVCTNKLCKHTYVER